MTTTPHRADSVNEAPSTSPFDALFTSQNATPTIQAESELPSDTGRRVGYARVSRASQVLDRQLDALKKDGCTEIFQEHYTGTSLRRPEFQRMCYSLNPGDTVVVTQLDRLGRNANDTLRVVAAFTELRVRFVVLDLNLDTATPHGKFALTMFAAIAELERSFIYERTMAGLEAARKRGHRGGRAKVIDKKRAADIVKWRFEWDMEIPAIAAKLRISERTVYRFLREKKESDAAGSDEFYDKYEVDNYSDKMPHKGEEPDEP